MSDQIPIFIISSGRTGSTLLAHMLNRHPDVLIVSDLFEPVGDEPYFHSDKVVSGTEFWNVLKRPSFPQRIKSWRQKPNAELLFLPPDDDMVSLLLCYTIPFISNTPMQEFEELEVAVRQFPNDTLPNQTIRFFELLRDKKQKSIWVERTGGSLPHTRKILENWPNAKIVHNFRNPRETAISMLKGSFFRLYLELENNPDLGDWDESHFPPAHEMGTMLNQWIVDAEAALANFPQDQQRRLRYEDLMSDTVNSLLALITFFFEREPNEADIKWAKSEAKVISAPPMRFPQLEAGSASQLADAVSESMDLLGYE
ncbi:MAG: sulfotransferase [Bacteroidota bacterium]